MLSERRTEQLPKAPSKVSLSDRLELGSKKKSPSEQGSELAL